MCLGFATRKMKGKTNTVYSMPWPVPRLILVYNYNTNTAPSTVPVHVPIPLPVPIPIPPQYHQEGNGTRDDITTTSASTNAITFLVLRSRRWLSGRACTSRHTSVKRLWVRIPLSPPAYGSFTLKARLFLSVKAWRQTRDFNLKTICLHL